MTMTGPASGGAEIRTRLSRHESFLFYEQYRWLKIAGALALGSIILYIADDPYGPRYGGSWAGYTLGTVGALLILWLMWFGYRKRSYRSGGQRNLATWLSAHVYLGLSLVVIGTLHTGFSFGWNVHTLAYVLMCVVIASGLFGVFCYARYPRLMTENRHGMTTAQMLSRIATLNEELRAGALALDDRCAALVRAATEETAIGGPVWRQVSGHYPHCTTAAALHGMDRIAASMDADQSVTARQIRLLLGEKGRLLIRVRRDVSFKAIMDIWLYFHVPLSFALLAALIGHVVAVFLLW
jgi:hypothetical protein